MGTGRIFTYINTEERKMLIPMLSKLILFYQIHSDASFNFDYIPINTELISVLFFF